MAGGTRHGVRLSAAAPHLPTPPEARAGRGSQFLSLAILVSALGVLVLKLVANVGPRYSVPLVVVLVGTAVGYRLLLAWRTLLATLVVVILFLPIRRYSFPGHLPFQMEPYRLLVAVIAAGWVASLLVDARVSTRRSGLEQPLAVVGLAAVGSVVVNASRISALAVGSDVAKKLTFLVSYFIVLYLVISVIRSLADVELLVRVFVTASAGLSVFAIVERSTGYNIFNHLSTLVPIVGHPDIPYSILHPTGRLRVYASAEHPIALGALFVMMLPLAGYLARTSGQRRWWLAAGLLALGTVATVSRTPIIMLLVVGIVFWRLRRRELKRLVPAILPLVLAAHFAVPGSLGSLKDAFFPRGGLVAQQEQGAGSTGSGRLAHLGPSMHELAQRPLLGEGYGTRIVDPPHANAPILDDQWLSTLLETGVIGALGWIWLYSRFWRLLAREARRDTTARGWLLTAILASVTSFAVGMFFFDAFSFVQVTFVLFILIALGMSAVQAAGAEARAEPA